MALEWILILIGILIVILILIVVYMWKKKNYKEPDYYGFFIMGLVWTVFGAVMAIIDNESIFFLPMGVVFLVLGLANKKKWKKWSGLGTKEKRIKMILVIILAAAVVSALVAFLLAEFV